MILLSVNCWRQVEILVWKLVIMTNNVSKKDRTASHTRNIKHRINREIFLQNYGKIANIPNHLLIFAHLINKLTDLV